MKYILAHDLGTSGNKATLFSEEGSLVASVTQHYPVYYSNLADMTKTAKASIIPTVTGQSRIPTTGGTPWWKVPNSWLPMWILLISPPYPSAAR